MKKETVGCEIVNDVNTHDEVRELFVQKTKVAFEAATAITGKKDGFFLYGGSVRNILLGIETSSPDYDFIGDFDLDKIQENFKSLVIGRWDSVSTIRLKLGLDIYDFTSAKVIEEHLANNDITISNLCVTKQGDLLDFVGGVEDLANRQIRIINPEEKIAKDPIRILRVFRFSGELGFSIEPNTLTAAIKYSRLLSDVPDIDDDLWQIMTLDEEKRLEILRLLHVYGIDKYLKFPDNVLNAVNILSIEKMIQKCSQVETVANMFDTDLYLIGGAIRDFVWGKNINDLDFKVLMPADDIIEVLENNGFERSEDYHTSERQYYISLFANVVGITIDGMDIHLSVMDTTDINELIKDGDVNFSCCVYNAKSKRIENPEIVKEIRDKTLLFCNDNNAVADPTIVLSALKQISRVPDITIPESTYKIIQAGIPKVAEFIDNNPEFGYMLEPLCSNINSELVYSFFGEQYKYLLEGIQSKKNKLNTSDKYISVEVNRLSTEDRAGIVELLKKAYGKHFDPNKTFSDNINSVVFSKNNGMFESCCLIDGERVYSVAARNGDGWSSILRDLVDHNYNVWGTVDCDNPKIQALCSIAGMTIENDPNIIRQILETKTQKYKDVEIYEYNGMTVFKKKNANDYPQILVRA